ncbi:MAG: hypothetical protein H0X64_10775, partial [Gemmatimonadaceae bacterium]|nr:hypothetical protein [Gemmatimonadaceae bacterium]
DYPGAPDSTVVRLRLPRALGSGDSIRIDMEWEARPSTTPRRQGRRGRHYDFAHWYPRIAVYDRGGWQHNALVPAGEFYGEFGTFDVTLVVRDDQVVGATGVPVAGDPGWARVRRSGSVIPQASAYGATRADGAPAPSGYRTVRWIARDVHHFAWSASPDYLYEGAAYVREAGERLPFRTWDTVAVHVLYRPGDEATWGNGIAVNRTIDALRWLEQAFGPYAYPQVTNLHRLDGGGTEFPMMMMNGSPSYGLILHELAHIYAHGILANNEWRSGWMDEGLASYLTNWAQGLTAQERAARVTLAPPRRVVTGYRGNAHTYAPGDAAGLNLVQLELSGRAEPIGTISHEFAEFTVYNTTIYSRAEQMFGALRDVIGDDAFRAFLRDYYRRWAFRHVDEVAMRASAERAHGRPLGWFFDQWIRGTGLVDYAMEGRQTVQRPDGNFATRVTVTRQGELAHPMPVGALADGVWTIGRAANPTAERQVVEIVTPSRPEEVRLDPLHVTADWDRRNDVFAPPFGPVKVVPDWPFLDQADRERTVLAVAPVAWYSAPGGATIGARVRSHYLNLVDRHELGLAFATRDPGRRIAGDGRESGSTAVSRIQGWARVENPTLPVLSRPLMGHAAGVAVLDGITMLDYRRTWDLSPFTFARGPRIAATAGVLAAVPFDRNFLPDNWKEVEMTELNATASARIPLGRMPASGPAPLDTLRVRAAAMAGYLTSESGVSGDRGYGRLEAEAIGVKYAADTATALMLRAFAGWNAGTPEQRTLRAGARDAIETFSQHWYRPSDAILRQDAVNYLPLGGAGLRAHAPDVFLAGALAVNGEVARRLYQLPDSWGRLGVWGGAFADVALVGGRHGSSFANPLVADAGVGASLRGRLFDRAVRLRVDLPVFATHPGQTFDGGASLAPRYVITLEDWY